jgi:hypothetical protein
MKITKENLTRANFWPLRIAQSKLGRNLSCLRLSASGGYFKIEACDGQQACEVLVKCEGDLDLVCVPPGIFGSAASFAVDSAQLHIHPGVVVFASGDRIVKIPIMPPESFNTLQFSGDPTAVDLVAMAEGIDKVSFCASNDPGRYILNSVHVLGEAERILVESGCGTAMAFYEKPASCADFDIVIPIEASTAVSWWLRQEEAELLLDEKSITITTAAGRYTTRLMEGEFYNTNPQRKASISTIAHIDRNQWVDAFKCIRSLRSAADSKLLHTMVEFGSPENKCCRISCQHSSGYEQVIEGAFNGDKLSLNALTFLACLEGFSDGATVELGFIPDFRAVSLKDGAMLVITTQVTTHENPS